MCTYHSLDTISEEPVDGAFRNGLLHVLANFRGARDDVLLVVMVVGEREGQREGGEN
jgi:hypothetical protein